VHTFSEIDAVSVVLGKVKQSFFAVIRNM